MEEIAYQSAGNALPMGIRQRGQFVGNDSDAAAGLRNVHDTNEQGVAVPYKEQEEQPGRAKHSEKCLPILVFQETNPGD